jgi:hypothetical protein
VHLRSRLHQRPVEVGRAVRDDVGPDRAESVGQHDVVGDDQHPVHHVAGQHRRHGVGGERGREPLARVLAETAET